jgi:glyoxylase-like metal-dependent hydrolase (beta-lactamase superfamily II)
MLASSMAFLAAGSPAEAQRSRDQASQGQAVQELSKAAIKVTSVTEGLYVIDESEAHGGSVSVLTGPEGTLLVDTGVAALAPKAAAAIRKLSAQPIRYVINTHVHVDETGGNEYFARQGATLIARSQVREEMLHPKAAGSADPREMRQVREHVADAAVPTIVYDGTMALHFDGQDIRLIALPPAHSDGDALIYFPDLDTVVAGDVLRANEFPSINLPSGGTLAGMLDALARLISLAGPRTRIVTSHGEVVDRAVALAQRDFLLLARDRVAALISQGKTADQVVAANVTADLGVHATPGHISADAFIRDLYKALGSP